MDDPKQRPGIEPDRSQAEVVRQIANMYLRGETLGAIAYWLMSEGVPAPKGGSVWYASTVQKVLSSPVHAGLLRNDGGLIKGAHYNERLYDPEVYYQILEEMKSRSTSPSATLSCPEAPLVRVAVCDECGTRLLVNAINNRYRAYYCGWRRFQRPTCSSRPYVRGDILEPRLVREIEKVAKRSRSSCHGLGSGGEAGKGIVVWSGRREAAIALGVS